MEIVLLEATLCALSWCLFHRRFLTYQLTILIVFLIALTLVGTLDMTLPVYFVAVCLSLLKGLAFRENFALCLYGLYGVYLLIGVLMQDMVGSFVTFITRLFQFIIFYLVFENRRVTAVRCRTMQMIWLAAIAETALGVYLLLNGTFIDAETGMARLVSNSQPITGNLAVVALPLILWEYFHPNASPQKRLTLIGVSAIFFIWIVLSGTRGYMVLFGLSVLVMYSDFLGLRFNGERWAFSRRSVLIVLILAAGAILLLRDPSVLENVSSALGLERTMGIRTYENAMVLDFFQNAGWPTKLFGIGIGGNGADYPAYLEALGRQAALGMWHLETYYNASGTTFHNLFANLLLTQGILGIGMAVAVFFNIFKKICQCCKNSTPVRISLLLYLIGFAIMNYFRWSAACGIPEMLVLAYVLRLQEQPTGHNQLR